MQLASDSQTPMRRRSAVGISAVLWLVSTFAVVLFWYDGQLQASDQAHRLIESSAEQSALRFEDFVRARIYALEQLAAAYSAGEEIEESDFFRSANAIHRSFDAVLAVNWVAPDSTIVWTIPAQENRAAKGRKLEEHETAAPYYTEARSQGEPRLTHPLELFQGGTGVAAYFPVVRNGEHLGTVNGVFRVDQLVQASLRGGVLDDYAVNLEDGDQVFFADAAFETLSTRSVSANRTFDVLDRKWTFEIAPRERLWKTLHPSHLTMLLVGLVCALLLALIAFLALERQRQRYESLRAVRKAEQNAQKIEKFDALGRLARGITHDFNNLLTAVGTSAELIELDENLSKDGQANVDTIRQASDRARDLTRQLMLFGNPDAALELTPTRLSDVSDKWEAFLSKLIASRVTFEFERAPDCVVTMDESSIMRVLTNIVVNASDAIDDRGTIRVSWRVEPDLVVMSVRDTGKGMSPEVRSRIFEPYFTTKGEDGTGLGLPTVYAMVQAAGGDVEVDSQPGVGTTFRVRFPRARD